MPEEARMNFGKYRGRPLSEVPLEYLYWTLRGADSMTDEMRDAVEDELEKRIGRIPSKRRELWDRRC
jgi:hypothetical protein